MSNYPGVGPETPDDQTPDEQPRDDQPSDTPGTEPTQPVGYWERQAAERAWEQAAGRPDPTTPYPQGQPPYGQQPYVGQPAGYPPQPGSYQPQPGPYQPQPGPMPYSAFSPPVPDHPQSTLALILGLVGLVGALIFCFLPLVVSPFAWAVGRSALKEIEESRGRLGGASNAKAGMIMGIIGTVILAILLVLVVVFIIAVAVGAESSTNGSSI